MKIFLKCSLILFLLVSLVNAQIPVPEGPFVKLSNESVIEGQSLTYEQHVLGASIINLDGKIIKSNTVNFFRDNNGDFYGRIRFSSLHKSVYESKGLYFFKVISTRSNGSSFGPYGGGGYYGGGIYAGNYGGYSQTITYYYSVGITKMKRFYITNLKDDIKDDAVAQMYVHNSLLCRRISQGAFLVAAVALLSNFAVFNPQAQTGNYNLRITTGVALGGFVISGGFYIAKFKIKEKAATKYTGMQF